MVLFKIEKCDIYVTPPMLKQAFHNFLVQLPYGLGGRLLDFYDPFKRRQWAGHISRLQQPSGGTGSVIVDVGCGPAPLKALFEEHGWRYIGLDRGVGEADADYSKIDVRADSAQLPFKSGSANAVISLVTLEHLPDPGESMKEMARLLKPGGCLYLAAPFLWETHQAPHDFFRFTRYGLARLANQAGLRVESLEPIGGYFQLMAYRLLGLLKYLQHPLGWPFFILLYPLLGIVLFWFLNQLDRLIPDPDFAMGHRLVAVKEGP